MVTKGGSFCLGTGVLGAWKRINQVEFSGKINEYILFWIIKWQYTNTELKSKKAYNTRYSQKVFHPSTNRARRCLTSVIGREPVYSVWYGRRRNRCVSRALYNITCFKCRGQYLQKVHTCLNIPILNDIREIHNYMAKWRKKNFKYWKIFRSKETSYMEDLMIEYINNKINTWTNN